MSWEDLADRTLKTAISVFKTPATYTPSDTDFDPIDIDGVFDRNSQAVDLNTGAKVDSYNPSFGIRFKDLTEEYGDDFEIQQGDRLAVKGKNYRVIEAIEDTEGGVKLMLSLTS